MGGSSSATGLHDIAFKTTLHLGLLPDTVAAAQGSSMRVDLLVRHHILKTMDGPETTAKIKHNWINLQLNWIINSPVLSVLILQLDFRVYFSSHVTHQNCPLPKVPLSRQKHSWVRKQVWQVCQCLNSGTESS